MDKLITNGVIIRDSKGKELLALSNLEFNEFKHLTLTRLENGVEKEARIIKFTPKKKIIMS